MPEHPFRNSVLSHLSADSVKRLHLQKKQMEITHEIENTGEPIRYLYFLEDGIASMTNTFLDGSQAEVGLFGYESVIGGSALMGTHRSLNRIYMQSDGWGYACKLADAEREFRRFDCFHDAVLRFTQAQLMQTAQTAGCNAHHNVHQRFARWVLLCNDRLGSDTLPITHEFLGIMLGIRRSSISSAAEYFRNRDLIRYSRGKLRIVDKPGLELQSCECYRAVRDHLNNYLDVVQDS